MGRFWLYNMLLISTGRFWLSIVLFLFKSSHTYATCLFWLSVKVRPLVALNRFNGPLLALQYATFDFNRPLLAINSLNSLFSAQVFTHMHNLVRVNGATANNMSLGVALLLGQRLLDPG